MKGDTGRRIANQGTAAEVTHRTTTDMTEVDHLLSKQNEITGIFSQIAGVPDPQNGIAVPGTGIAEPGDLLFFITHHPDQESLDTLRPKGRLERLKTPLIPFMRRSYGFAENEFDQWHVGIYLMGRKHHHHRRMNLWMIHSHPGTHRKQGGVHTQHLSPAAFANNPPAPQTRLEILQFTGIRDEQRRTITETAAALQGAKFDDLILLGAKLSLLLGLPNVISNRSSVSCQSLVVNAYAAAGIHFPHPYKSFPWWNIGRLLGHPLGHPKDRVNPRYPYLMDHHIYRDPRFEVKAVLLQESLSRQFRLSTASLEKYSWNRSLRTKYADVGVQGRSP